MNNEPVVVFGRRHGQAAIDGAMPGARARDAVADDVSAEKRGELLKRGRHRFASRTARAPDSSEMSAV